LLILLNTNKPAQKAVEEQQTNLFLIGSKIYKLIEDMKSNILRKKDPFPKTVAESCHILSKFLLKIITGVSTTIRFVK